MADPHILTTLRAKRNEVEAAIKAYEARAEAARRDLAHINATLALFAVDGDPSEIRAYADTSRLFKRGELATLCRSALAEHGPQDTRELARRVAEAKRLRRSRPAAQEGSGLSDRASPHAAVETAAARFGGYQERGKGLGKPKRMIAEEVGS